MIWIAIFVLLFTAVRLLVAFVNLAGRQWLKKSVTDHEPLVSVLIPARNEEKNIGKILHDLANHDYPSLEVMVYDDLSEDKTPQIVKQIADRYENIVLIEGKPLPGGWLGKNHACHNLAMHARGKYLLFLDADVKIKNGLIRNAIAHTQNHKLKLLSIFPVQKMNSFAERLTVPVMNWILVSLLPLILTRISSRPSLSAANGQFMLFDAEVYHIENFHKTLKDQKVEDIAIFRLMKSKGYKVETLLGNDAISCRMYHSWDEAVQGFSKNVFEYFGGSRILALLFGLVTTFGFIFVIWSLPAIYLLLYFSMAAVLRIIVSVASRQNVFYNLILAPLQQLSFLYITFKALSLQKKKATQWKGRNIDLIK
ncbi:MAG: glycosyltransferase family 2 protein [Bacteroidales bacterium]|nr:glycosyltransferase family 2 protein [Bacteroidales bacterium]